MLLAGDARSLLPGTPCTSTCSSCTSAKGLMRAKNKALLKSSHFLEQQVGNNSQERVPEHLHHEAAQPPHVWQYMRRAVLGFPVGLALPKAQTAWP